MLPDDGPEVISEAGRQALFAAIAEGRFQCIADLAAEYKQQAARYLMSRDEESSVTSRHELAKPLTDALDYLRVVRAHQSSRFQKLAIDGIYRPAAASAKGRTLDVDA
jgi:hypothetical protein